MAKRKQALDVNQVFAYRLRDARLTKRWDQQDLAEAMARVGHPINRATISKIEAGARGVGGIHGSEGIKAGQTRPRNVSLDEAVAFAVALDVPVLSLLLPVIREDDVQLAPEVRVDVDTAHAWARGEQPLRPDDPDGARFYRFQRYEPPAPPATREELEAMGITVGSPAKRKRKEEEN